MKRKFLKTLALFLSFSSFLKFSSLETLIVKASPEKDNIKITKETASLESSNIDKNTQNNTNPSLNFSSPKEKENAIEQTSEDIDSEVIEKETSTNDISNNNEINTEDVKTTNQDEINLNTSLDMDEIEQPSIPSSETTNKANIEVIPNDNTVNPLLFKNSYITTKNKESIKYSDTISFKIKGAFDIPVDLNSILVIKNSSTFNIDDSNNTAKYKNKIVFSIDSLDLEQFNPSSLKYTVTFDEKNKDILISININNLNSSNYKVDIFACDNNYSSDKITSSFTVDNIAPTVNLKFNGDFKNDSIFLSNKNIRLKSNYIGSSSKTLSDVIEFIVLDNNINKEKSGFNIYDDNNSSILPSNNLNDYTISMKKSGNIYKVIYTAFDLAMNKTEKIFKVVIDNEAPTVDFIPSITEHENNKTPITTIKENNNYTSHYLLNSHQYKKLEFKLSDSLLYNSLEDFKSSILPTIKISSNNKPLSSKTSTEELNYLEELKSFKYNDITTKISSSIEEREDGIFLVLTGADNYIFQDNHFKISFSLEDLIGNKTNYESFLTIDTKKNTFKTLTLGDKLLTDSNGNFINETLFINKASEGTLIINKPLSGLITKKAFFNNTQTELTPEKEDDYSLTYKFQSKENGSYFLTSNFTSNIEYRLNNFISTDITLPWIIDTELPYLMNFSIPGKYNSKDKNYYYSKNISKSNTITATFRDDISYLNSIDLKLKDSTGTTVSSGSNLESPSKEFTSSLKFNTNKEGSFQLIATISDRAKNGLNKEINLGNLIIDNTAPKVSISGVNGNYIESENKSYINKTVNLSLDVNDDNISEDTSNLIINGQSNGRKKTLTKNGDYTIKVSASDLAGNTTSSFLSPYTSDTVTSTSFVIDTLAPIITCKNIIKEKHYNKKIKPEIEINEETIYKEMKLNQAFYSGEVIEKDGKYTLVISAEDKALNKGIIEIPFVIDTIAPKIKISGINIGKLNKGPIKPKIEVNEALSKVTSSINGKSFSGGEISGDGKFSLVVYAVDKAGNKTKETANFHLRTTPLDILVKNITEGAILYGSITPKIDINSKVQYTYKLNGQPYNGEEITTPGKYTLEVISKDELGIENTKKINFILKSKANAPKEDLNLSEMKSIVLSGGLFVLIFAIGTVTFIIKKKH